MKCSKNRWLYSKRAESRGCRILSTVDFTIKENYTIEDLLKIVATLRGENGCPWDREQTHDSIKSNLLEETYEAYEAIVLEDTELLKEELGDILLQVVFHAQIEKEMDHFNFDQICDGVCKKLVERHPHVFGNVQANTSEQVMDNWEKIKQRQKHQTTATETLRAVPTVFPALMKAQKVQKRAAKAGFDYPETSWAMKDLAGEVEELQSALAHQDADNALEELGDVIFSAVNVARFIGADAESALNEATNKFIDRFEKVEQLALSRKIDMQSSSIEELDALWKEVKHKTTSLEK